MPKVHFLNEAKTIDAPSGKTVLELAQAADISVFKGFWKSYHCSGKGRCLGSGCKVWVSELENGAVSPMSSWKERLRWRLKGSQRLACQVTVTGDCEIRTQPGALEFDEDMTWEPDARRYAWHDRLVVEKKKKKPKPKPAPKKAEAKPEAESKPAPEAESKPAPEAESKPAPEAESKPAPEAESKPAPEAESKPAPEAESKPAPAPKPDAVEDTESAVETPAEDVDTTQDAVEDADDVVETPTAEAAPAPAPAADAPEAPSGKARRRSVPSDTDSGWE